MHQLYLCVNMHLYSLLCFNHQYILIHLYTYFCPLPQLSVKFHQKNIVNSSTNSILLVCMCLSVTKLIEKCFTTNNPRSIVHQASAGDSKINVLFVGRQIYKSYKSKIKYQNKAYYISPIHSMPSFHCLLLQHLIIVILLRILYLDAIL